MFTFKDVSESKFKCPLGCCACVSLLIIILVSTSVKQVDRLHSALLKNGMTGEVSFERSYEPGRYMVGFWYEFIHFPTTLNTIDFSDETPEEGVQKNGRLEARDQDGKKVFLDVSVQYRIIPEKLGEIYREMTTLYEDVYISELKGKLRSAANLFQISEAWTDYTGVQSKMKAVCKDVLLQRHAECWGLQLWGVRLQDQYEQALITTQVRKQAQVTERARKTHTSFKAETQVVLAEYRKNETIIRSAGSARKVQIEREAKSESQAALISAQGEVLKLVSDTVMIPANGSHPALRMSSSQLVQYQRILMMTGSKKHANFVVSSGDGYMKAVEVP